MVYCTSILVCEKVRKHERNETMTWIESLFMCFVGVFGRDRPIYLSLGGTTIASLLMGCPVFFLTQDSLVLGLLAAWYAITSFFPIGLPFFGLRTTGVVNSSKTN